MSPLPPASTLAEIAAAVARLEERVSRIEHGARGAERLAAIESAQSEPLRIDLALIGRSLIVFGGAYLLRAITDAALVPTPVGAGIGLGYAAALLALADRACARGRPASGAFHGATALAIAYPLIGELVVRFHLIGPTSGAALVLIVFAAAMSIAHRRHATALAWIAVGATLAAAIVLPFETGSMLPFV